MTDDELRTTSKPPMRLGRVAAIALAIVMTPLVAWVGWDLVEASRLRARLDELYPLVDADKARDTPTAEQQEVVRLYSEASRLAKPSPTDDFDLRLREAGKMLEELSLLPLPEARRDPRLASLRQLEEPYAEALALFDRGAAIGSPDSLASLGYDGDRMFLRDVSGYRRVANLNALRVARLAFAGDGEAAANAIVSTLRLRRILAGWFPRSPFRTVHSLEMALTFAPPSEKTLAHLEREYDATQPDEALEQILVDSRYGLARTFAPEEFGLSGGPGHNRIIEALLFRLVRPVRYQQLRTELDLYEGAIRIAREPWPGVLDSAKRFSEPYERRRQPARRRSFMERFTPFVGAATIELSAVAPGVCEVAARARASMAALAVERYRRAHGGALPASLADLTPEFLPAPLLDPFSGGELRYRTVAHGYGIYSVGSNRTDDGGEWEPTSDLNPFRRGDPKDLGIAIRVTSRTQDVSRPRD